jgi:acyl-CoA synthetase (AMP-forming)/AMP-acid ligase II
LGQVAIRGENITRGYLDNPEANAAAFAGEWFLTGDQGYFDPDGYIFLTGRIKELINRGGEKIAPREIDEVLLNHPAVEQALAFALPDPTWGERVAACVVLRPGRSASSGELREYCAQQLAAFKVPDQIMFLEQIPLGPTGKPQRIGLAQRLGIE